WNPAGSEPTTMAEVFNRQKDVQYSSRIASQIVRQQQIHRLRHVINQPVKHLPEAERNSPAARELACYGCQTRMHVVRLLAPQLDHETHTKDIDFSPDGIKERWEAGYAHTRSVLARAPWVGEFDPLSGVVFHEHMELMPQAAEGFGRRSPLAISAIARALSSRRFNRNGKSASVPHPRGYSRRSKPQLMLH